MRSIPGASLANCQSFLSLPSSTHPSCEVTPTLYFLLFVSNSGTCGESASIYLWTPTKSIPAMCSLNLQPLPYYGYELIFKLSILKLTECELWMSTTFPFQYHQLIWFIQGVVNSSDLYLIYLELCRFILFMLSTISFDLFHSPFGRFYQSKHSQTCVAMHGKGLAQDILYANDYTPKTFFLNYRKYCCYR